MYVLFDAQYTTRLWCVFELAVYMRLRENPKVRFISTEKCIIGVVRLVGVSFVELVVNVIQDATSQTDSTTIDILQEVTLDASLVSSIRTAGYESSVWAGYILILITTAIVYILADRYWRAIRDLRNAVKKFDVANTKLASETDRVMLLSIVNELFEQPEASPHPSAASIVQSELKKNSRNFRVSREMREKNRVYNPFSDEF